MSNTSPPPLPCEGAGRSCAPGMGVEGLLVPYFLQPGLRSW
jgi:hypothetical protein